MRFASREEQLLADASKRFQNIIIAWNYLYLTDLMLKSPTQEGKNSFKYTSSMGTYQFTVLLTFLKSFKDFLDFDMEEYEL